MNILYIGPFQQNNDIGYCSSAVLKHLCSLSEHKVFAYPIYSGSDNISISSIPYFRFKELVQYPDINIQHCHISHLYIDPYSKNYFIPIHNLDSTIATQYINKLKNVDKIIVYNDFDYQKYLDIGIDNNIVTKIEVPPVSVTNELLDIGIYQQYKKYYFIGNFKSNVSNITSIMYNFLSITKNYDNTCLIICSECDHNEKQQLVSLYNDMKEKLCLNMKEDKILFIVDNISISIIQKLHNTGDYFLCLNNAYFPLTDVAMAKANGNHIIDYCDIDLDTQNYGFDNYKYTLLQESLRTIFTDIKPRNTDKYPIQQLENIL